jgi:hypothetical protein
MSKDLENSEIEKSMALLKISFQCNRDLKGRELKVLQNGVFKNVRSFEFASINEDGEMKLQNSKTGNVSLY